MGNLWAKSRSSLFLWCRHTQKKDLNMVRIFQFEKNVAFCVCFQSKQAYAMEEDRKQRASYFMHINIKWICRSCYQCLCIHAFSMNASRTITVSHQIIYASVHMCKQIAHNTQNTTAHFINYELQIVCKYSIPKLRWSNLYETFQVQLVYGKQSMLAMPFQ